MLSRISAHLTRRRMAFLIVSSALLGNAYLDYLLIVGNPQELEAQATRILKQVLPNYSPQFSPNTTLNLLERRLILKDVKFHEKDDPSRVLFRIPELQVTSTALFDKFSVKAIKPQMVLRVDRDGNLNIPEGGAGSTGQLPVELDIEIEDGRLVIISDFQDRHREVLIRVNTKPDRPIQLKRNMSATGAGEAYVGALLPPGDRAYVRGDPRTDAAPDDLPATQRDRTRHVIQRLGFELEHSDGGPVLVSLDGRVELSRELRGLVPEPFQSKVWDFIGIGGDAILSREARGDPGQVQLGLRLKVPPKGVTSVDVSLTPFKAVIKPKGFPIDVKNIGRGRFEISVAVPEEGPPKFLGVAWENVEATVGKPRQGPWGIEQGRVRGRGSVFPGGENERVTLHLYIDVTALPLTQELSAAFPPKIRDIYEQFEPRGMIKKAYVQIFKAPFDRDILFTKDGQQTTGVLVNEGPNRAPLVEDEEGDLIVGPGVAPGQVVRFRSYRGVVTDWPAATVARIEPVGDIPSISVHVPELAGTLSARFIGPKDSVTGERVGVPAKLENIHGWFTLNQDANVEMHGEGELELGGTAVVDARVSKGDLIAVTIKARDVPAGKGLVEVLPPGARKAVESFNLGDGKVDVHLTLSKPREDAPVQPVIRATLRDVSLLHDEFKLPLKATGKVQIIPVFEHASQEEPSRIEATLDVKLNGSGVVGAIASGTLTIPPTQPVDGLRFTSNLDLRAERVDMNQLPKESKLLRDIYERLQPAGVVRRLRANIRGHDRLTIRGRGQDLQLKPTFFSYVQLVDKFAAQLDRDRVTYKDVEGRSRAGGSFKVRGHVVLPDAAPRGPPGQNDLDLEMYLSMQDLKIDRDLIQALPDTVRGSLNKLSPSGLATGQMHMRFTPGEPLQLDSTLDIKDGRASLTGKIHESLANLSAHPAQKLAGRIQMTQDRIVLSKLSGVYLGSALKAEGSMDLAEGDLKAFDLRADLTKLDVNSETRKLAGDVAKEFFKQFQVDGLADFQFKVFKAPQEEDTHVHMVVKPRGQRVIASLVPVPISRLTGEVRVEDGEPTYIKLDGYLDPPVNGFQPAVEGPEASAQIHVRREAKTESRFPGQGKAGRAYHVWLEGLRRFRDIKHRIAFEERLPSSWRKTLNRFDPTGRIDVDAWVYQPNDDQTPMRWVAETRVRDFGMRLITTDPKEPRDWTKINGTARLHGRLSEFKLGEATGELRLARADLFKQTIGNLSGVLGVRNGVLYVGRDRDPFTAKFYKGDLRGITTYDFVTQRYSGVLGLGIGKGSRPGSMRVAVKQMNRLADPKKKEEKDATQQDVAYRGKILAQVNYSGGGLNLKGNEIGISGLGDLRVEDSNLLDTPGLKRLQSVLNSLPFIERSTDALPNMHMHFKIKPDLLDLVYVELWGRTLRLRGEEGEFWMASPRTGYLDIDMVLGKSEGGLNRFLAWTPFAGYQVRGKVQDGVNVSTVGNPFSTIQWLVDQIKKAFGGEGE